MYISSIEFDGKPVKSLCLLRRVYNHAETYCAMFIDNNCFNYFNNITIDGIEYSFDDLYQYLDENCEEIQNLCMYKTVETWGTYHYRHIAVPSSLDLSFRDCLDMHQIATLPSHSYMPCLDACDTFISCSNSMPVAVGLIDIIRSDIILSCRGGEKLLQVSIKDKHAFDILIGKYAFLKGQI